MNFSVLDRTEYLSGGIEIAARGIRDKAHGTRQKVKTKPHSLTSAP
jgi:hypothetical protein